MNCFLHDRLIEELKGCCFFGTYSFILTVDGNFGYAHHKRTTIIKYHLRLFIWSHEIYRVFSFSSAHLFYVHFIFLFNTEHEISRRDRPCLCIRIASSCSEFTGNYLLSIAEFSHYCVLCLDSLFLCGLSEFQAQD